jgi:cytochrome c-type biogenesis protein CcmH
VKVVIRERIAMGNTDEEIRDFIASRYGRDVLLEPSGTGFSAVVWALPVVVVVVAVGGLAYRFRDWRPTELPVTDEDRARVEAARSRVDEGSDQT